MNKYMLMPAAAIALITPSIVPANAQAATSQSASFSTANPVIPGWHYEQITTKTGSIQTTASGSTETGGWVEFTGEGTVTMKTVKVQNTVNSHPRPMMGLTEENVGGGQWIYGSNITWRGQKVCESKYTHPTMWHSATAQMGNGTRHVTAGAGGSADATVTAYTLNSCIAHWSHG